MGRLKKRTTRFAGADWADELREITLIGAGGIGSWTCLNLSRIGHGLTVYDGDNVDQTNVMGGQMYQMSQVGENKAYACYANCRAFGTVAPVHIMNRMFTADDEVEPICITGLDNMAARKLAFAVWRAMHGEDSNALFIDGRLPLENMEIFTIRGGDHMQLRGMLTSTYLMMRM